MLILDPDGAEISVTEFIHRYRVEGVVAEETTPSGHRVSTIWVGVDDRPEPTGAPLIFETLVTGPGAWHGHRERYATATHALAGHRRIVSDLTTPPSAH